MVPASGAKATDCSSSSGHEPRRTGFRRSLIRDQWDYVCTGRDVLDLLAERAAGTWPLERDPYLLETSVPGILAAGDVRHGSIKRCAAAVGEGSMAIAVVHQYLAEATAPTIGRPSPAERGDASRTSGRDERMLRVTLARVYACSALRHGLTIARSSFAAE